MESIQGLTVSAEIRNCKITGNRTGIDINNSTGNNIHNNIITFNRTGLLLEIKPIIPNLSKMKFQTTGRLEYYFWMPAGVATCRFNQP
ncbi:MAG: right-handed parallel beta-helix repeat-containing protein [Saprospiraceae bacterium]|nr:right-handed parallel beta-helix repeat-containing protein [Saprospiraceae bacterium]